MPHQILCAHCGRKITGQHIVFDDKHYHEQCFDKSVAPRCAVCGKALTGQYVVVNGKEYHQDCYDQSEALRCSICDKPLVGRYIIDFWGNNYHPHHNDEIPSCDYCRRLISPRSTGGSHQYADGRTICNICYESAIEENSGMVSIIKTVQTILARKGIKIDMSDVPVQLVDKPTLGRLTGHGDVQTEMGLAHYQYSKNLTGQIRDRKHIIYILHGLPERTFEGVAAHEMMHVWTNLNAPKTPAPRLNEGISNCASFWIYSRHRDQMAEYLIRNLRENPDPVYGEGFRQVQRYIRKKGLRSLLEHLKNSATMPR